MLPFDVPADGEYGGIRAELEAAGRRIGSNDADCRLKASAPPYVGTTCATSPPPEPPAYPFGNMQYPELYGYEQPYPYG